MNSRSLLAWALGAAAATLGGCVVVPTGNEGQYAYYPLTVLPPNAARADSRVVPVAFPPGTAAMPLVLQARLYPANDIAAQAGVLVGTVTNMMNGKGRFQLQYGTDVLTGEATRVDGDARRGVASAYGANGGFMSCEYQMSSPRQGAGTCTFSNGALFKAHIGV